MVLATVGSIPTLLTIKWTLIMIVISENKEKREEVT